MDVRKNSTVKRSSKEKIYLVLFGFILSIIFIELLLTILSFCVEWYYTSDFSHGNEDFVILTLGESTTAGKRNWPSLLEEELQSIYVNESIRVVNTALPGTNTGLILSGLEEDIDYYNPDLVISMIGVNDDSTNFIYGSESLFERMLHHSHIRKLLKWVFSSKKELNGNLEDEYYTALTKDIRNKSQISDTIDGSMIDNYCSSLSVNYSVKKCIGLLYDAMYIDLTDRIIYDTAELIAKDASYNYAQNSTTYKKHEAILLNATSLFENNYRYFNSLGFLYCSEGTLDKATAYFNKASEIAPQYDPTYAFQADCYASMGKSEEFITRFLRSNRRYLHYLDSYQRPASIFRYNYRILIDILDTHDIDHVVMQYPLTKLSMSENNSKRQLSFLDLTFLLNRSDIIFVENYDNFEDALKTYEYQDLFIDRFGGYFGHKTLLGNQILVDNLVATIRPYLDKQLQRETGTYENQSI